ncbi:thioesterase II family protein [Streptomyces bohaiensis]|uniref:Thioesterase n=1 Tax=Streptomyces bohaiensis TaxID=1431344 RepID=A0ABX1C3L1_9ACTN|nr:alpha/beta fold hydrolase [Streptomyces bohaiensis]NJQ13814.1 thioesterase [Streptomyces bohaiensis]
MTTTDGTPGWFPCGPPRPAPGVRLFCLPYAGGGASAYRDWPEVFGPEIDVVPLQPPGRGERRDQPPHRDMAELVSDAAEALVPWLDGAPYALFGHSMGALVAYELACHLRERGTAAPEQLIVSSHRAPQARWPGYTDDAVSEEQAEEMLRLFAAPSPQTPRPVGPVRPLLLSDLTLCARYRHRARDPLAMPLTALGGADDPLVPPATLAAWRVHTTGPFHRRLLPGGHFPLRDRRVTVRDLLRPARPGPHADRPPGEPRPATAAGRARDPHRHHAARGTRAAEEHDRAGGEG